MAGLLAKLTLAPSWLVFVFAPGDARAGQTRAHVPLPTGGNAYVCAARPDGQSDARPGEIEMDARKQADAALEAKAHLMTMMARPHWHRKDLGR